LDSTARLWDVATGKTVATLTGHKNSVTAVAFSPDGTRVLTGSEDKTARLWTVFKSAQALIDTVRTSVPRCLTPTERQEFHLGTPPPRWCYERNLWPFADHGPPYTDGGSPPYGPTTDLGRKAARDLGPDRFVVQRSCCKARDPIAAMFCNARTTLDDCT
jgi:hypothetical protein